MASLSPAVLLKLLVLDEEREMLDRPFSFSLMYGLSLLGHISGELGFDDVSDFTSCDEWAQSGVFGGPDMLSLRVRVSDGISAPVCNRGKRPDLRFIGLLDCVFVTTAGGEKVVLVTSALVCTMPPLRLPVMPAD